MEEAIINKRQSWFVWFLYGVLTVFFLILFARLIELTVIKGNYYRSLSDENRIRRIPILAKRGKIIARGGEILVDNQLEDSNYLSDRLSETKLIIPWKRVYPRGEAFAHLTGYLGEVSSDELGKVLGDCPEKGPKVIGSLIGRGGLEEFYECLLSGVNGEELIEVDAFGKNPKVLGKREAKDGENIYIHIDYGLQLKVYDLVKDRKASVIITRPNGEVLSLVSSPSYDPNVFVDSEKSDQRKNILEDSKLPLFNRVIGGLFHPGSVFKPLVALASLEEGVIDKNYRYKDEGQIVIKTLYGNFSYKNWYFTQYGGVEGEIGLVKALSRSTDTFFYKIGELAGIKSIVEWSDELGLNKKSGIDLPGEVEGLVPSPEWKMKVKGERWFLGNTYHISIGQGDLALTPLAINRYISAIATGKLCKPRLVGEGECKDLSVNRENLKLIVDGMKGACSSGGTGYTFFDFQEKTGLNVACKTGTAENEGKDPHAWFTVFAPAENPEIIATVLIENAGEGSKVAGPIARAIFDYYFSR